MNVRILRTEHIKQTVTKKIHRSLQSAEWHCYIVQTDFHRFHCGLLAVLSCFHLDFLVTSFQLSFSYPFRLVPQVRFSCLFFNRFSPPFKFLSFSYRFSHSSSKSVFNQFLIISISLQVTKYFTFLQLLARPASQVFIIFLPLPRLSSKSFFTFLSYRCRSIRHQSTHHNKSFSTPAGEMTTLSHW